VVDGDSDKLAAMISFTSFKDVGGFKLAQGDEKSVMVTPSGTSLWVAFVVDSGTPSLGTNQLRANLNIYRS
jgi:hypothetical protein